VLRAVAAESSKTSLEMRCVRKTERMCLKRIPAWIRVQSKTSYASKKLAERVRLMYAE